MFDKVMTFYISYCLCFVEEISMYMVEEQAMEETELELNGEEDFSIYDDMEEHRKEV